jgi:hypothetical protein
MCLCIEEARNSASTFTWDLKFSVSTGTVHKSGTVKHRETGNQNELCSFEWNREEGFLTAIVKIRNLPCSSDLTLISFNLTLPFLNCNAMPGSQQYNSYCLSLPPDTTLGATITSVYEVTVTMRPREQSIGIL